jgi:hypothetical protein
MLARPTFVAIASIFVAALCILGSAHSAPADAATKQRVFEIRTYTTEPGKLPALLTRFRDHTTKLFEKHGMTNIGYWAPTDGPRSGDTLIYILAHDSRAAADNSWDAFRNDPEWTRARNASEAAGPIVKSVESLFASPTDFSPIK